MSKPGIIRSMPSASELQRGRASQKYKTAKTKPSGTRMRRAMRDHSGILSFFDQFARRAHNRIDIDLQQAGIGVESAGVRSEACGTAQDNASRSGGGAAGGV